MKNFNSSFYFFFFTDFELFNFEGNQNFSVSNVIINDHLCYYKSILIFFF